jgi:glycosyltransferase involved in cell wall biosynthesis
MKFTLIIATLGRKKELLSLFDSINNIDYEKSNIEIIIVDQNKKGFLDKDLSMFDNLFIKHIHSEKIGLSYSRNLGLSYATGDIVCFPDDDCKFYNNTLLEASSVLLDANIDFCMGRIYDRETKNNIIKNWPENYFLLNRFNSYLINSSITLFVKHEFILNFDENLGVGAKFGSSEDADLIYRMLENKTRGIYTPKIELWHPVPNYQEISLVKVKNYAAGFGYFVRKNIDFVKIILLFLLVAKKSFQLVMNFYNKRFCYGYFGSFFGGLLFGLLYKRTSR